MKTALVPSQKASKLKRGIYQHYKGPKYEVLDVVRHSETLEEMVCYKKLEDGGLWIRPLKMFLENIEINSKTTPRFRYLG